LKKGNTPERLMALKETTSREGRERPPSVSFDEISSAPPTHDSVRDRIDQIRKMENRKDGLRTFEAHRKCWYYIQIDLLERGRFYYDGRMGYIFLTSDGQLLAIEPDNQSLELLLSWYGVARSEQLYRYVVDALRLEALELGTRTQVYSFTHYDVEANVLYLFDFNRWIYRISSGGWNRVANGTDGILFLHNSSCESFLVGAADPVRSDLNDVLLSKVPLRDENLTINDQRILFLMWFYALFFTELFPTKPILAIVGERGSVKSFSLKKVGRLLYGPAFHVMPLSEDPKDFDAAITNTPFVAIDNSDQKIRWLDDRLAVAATGGSIKRREYYTTNRLVEYPIRAFIAVTSRTPQFRREDVADRLIILHVDRLETFKAESRLLAELVARRDAVMTEVVGHLQEIVEALGTQAERTIATRCRMADFADFALKIAYAQGWGDHMLAILEGLSAEQSAFAIEGDPLAELLDLWLKEGDGRNAGREVRTRELGDELAKLANLNGIQFPFAGKTQALAQRLRNAKSALGEVFQIGERKGKGGYQYWSFAFRDGGK